MKYILVTGGVLSGIGKGIIASSTGMLLRSLGFNVSSIKIGMVLFIALYSIHHMVHFSSDFFSCTTDPYINIDAGTMSPFEHGEVFVLDDGGEVDLDLVCILFRL